MTKQSAATTKVDPGATDSEALPKAGASDTPMAPAPVGERAPDAVAGEDFAVPGSDPSSVEKITVKTTGDFHLQDPWTGTLIDAASDGTEVVKTSFITDKLEAKQLEEV